MMKRLLFLLPLAVLALLPGCASGPLRSGYSVTAYKPHNPANVRIKVSLSKQNVYVMEGDRCLLAAATNVGLREKPTPTGNFKIYNKIANKRSGSYGFYVQGNSIVPGETSHPQSGRYVGYPMGYWSEFSPAYGFHAGYVWPMPRTHGCLRLHKTVAPKFYELAKIGTPVNIAYTQPEDATIGRNVPRPTDFRDDDPPGSVMISDAAFYRPSGPLLIEQ